MKRKYKCQYCDYAPSRKWNLKKHLIFVHRVENNEIQDNLQQHDVIKSELQTSSHCPVHRQANYHPEYLTRDSTSNQNQLILDTDESTTTLQDNFARYTPMYQTESYADDVNNRYLEIDKQSQTYDPACQTVTYYTDDQTRYPTESFNPSREHLISECQPKSQIEDDEIKVTEQPIESMIESLQGQYKDFCSICGAEGPYNLMRQHFINCRSNLLKCHECNKTFLSRWKYNIHMKSEH